MDRPDARHSVPACIPGGFMCARFNAHRTSVGARNASSLNNTVAAVAVFFYPPPSLHRPQSLPPMQHTAWDCM